MGVVRIGLVGCGYWGPKVIRAAASLPDVHVSALVDHDRSRAEALARHFAGAAPHTRLEGALDAVDAVIIATNPATHAVDARLALESEKHALVEKPMALTSDDCRRLADVAAENEVVLMAGHTFLFSPAVQHVKELIESGELGRIYTIDSQRLSLGRVRADVDALWNFAPHDVAIVNHWLGGAPAAVSCTRYSYLQAGVADVGFMTLEWEEGAVAHIHVSWLSPRKVRNIAVVGSRQMVVYDDTATDAKLVVHNAGIDREHIDRSFPEFETYGEFQLIQRMGDLYVPRLANIEPLVAECRHFVECIQTGRQPLTGAEAAGKVVAVLEAASASAANGGTRVELMHV
jgi:predicted dehydrogenase